MASMDTQARQKLLTEALISPQFPRSAAYDLEWQYENAMGPNPLWLIESLSELMDLRPGIRVLDLGCGKAITSIFLAREFGVQVVAADLWIKPSENWPRIVAAGAESQVLPLDAEAHDLKFAEGYFDAIVSLDSYHYYGTDDLYLSYLARFLRSGGQIGIVVPAVVEELSGEVPVYIRGWEADCWSFHSPRWWRDHWSKSDKVQVEHADLLPDGWRHWLRWEQLGAALRTDHWQPICEVWASNLADDAGRTLSFARVVARRSEQG
jgi:SAM-dependent methyltransferase